MNVRTDRHTDGQTYRQTKFTDTTYIYMWDALKLASITLLVIKILGEHTHKHTDFVNKSIRHQAYHPKA